jgi:hypothetical protein
VGGLACCAEIAWGAARAEVLGAIVIVVEMPRAGDDLTASGTGDSLTGVDALLPLGSQPLVLGPVAALVAVASGVLRAP